MLALNNSCHVEWRRNISALVSKQITYCNANGLSISSVPSVGLSRVFKTRKQEVIRNMAIESGWYFAVGISIPLVIWFFVTHLKELKGKDYNTRNKPTQILAE